MQKVKKRKTKKSSVNKIKKGNPFQSFAHLLKTILMGAAVVMFALSFLFYGFNYFMLKSNDKREVAKERQEEAKEDKVRRVVISEEVDKYKASSKKFKKGEELPKLKVKRKEQVIAHMGYTVSYNSDYKIANWVAYELTGKEVENKKAGRSNKFLIDPMVKGASAANEDYSRSGYDRGHLAPAGDMKWSEKAMRESFYLSNICPQKPGLNRGIWNRLEEQCRVWAKENGALLVVTGPVIEDNLKRLGKNGVGIPKKFYKVLCRYAGSRLVAIGFLFDNRNYGDEPLLNFVYSVDDIEKITGIDFFPNFSKDEEKRMEAEVEWNSWSF